MDDRKEAEKWEHLEEHRLWMKHVVGLMSDVTLLVLACMLTMSIASTQASSCSFISIHHDLMSFIVYYI